MPGSNFAREHVDLSTYTTYRTCTIGFSSLIFPPSLGTLSSLYRRRWFMSLPEHDSRSADWSGFLVDGGFVIIDRGIRRFYAREDLFALRNAPHDLTPVKNSIRDVLAVLSDHWKHRSSGGDKS
ncbi:hypothetical protein ES705_26690 [subsurface metagenome]